MKLMAQICGFRKISSFHRWIIMFPFSFPFCSKSPKILGFSSGVVILFRVLVGLI